MTTIIKLLKALNANRRPAELAFGMAFGIWLGILPGMNIVWFLVFTLFFLLKVHGVSGFLFMGLVQPFLPLIDPYLDTLGYTLLTHRSYEAIQVFISNLPAGIVWQLDQTLVVGGFLVGGLAFLPLALLFLGLIHFYRRFIHPYIFNNRIAKGFMKIPLVKKIITWYKKYEHITG